MHSLSSFGYRSPRKHFSSTSQAQHPHPTDRLMNWDHLNAAGVLEPANFSVLFERLTSEQSPAIDTQWLVIALCDTHSRRGRSIRICIGSPTRVSHLCGAFELFANRKWLITANAAIKPVNHLNSFDKPNINSSTQNGDRNGCGARFQPALAAVQPGPQRHEGRHSIWKSKVTILSKISTIVVTS